MARVASDIRERMPLHAVATSNGIVGKLMTLPSRRTGTPKTGNVQAASFEAKVCKGKVIWLKTIAGIGTIRTRKDKGKRTARNMVHPRKKITIPAINRIRETRERNSSAPKTPTPKVARKINMTGNPQAEGCGLIAARRARVCQNTKPEKKGTKKPWEKSGSDHHWRTRRAMIGAYSQATKIRTAAVYQLISLVFGWLTLMGSE